MIIIAKTQKGLEEVLYKEVEALGGTSVERWTRAVKFEGDTSLLYKACICLRTAIRVITPIAEHKVSSYDDAYNKIRAMAWENIFTIRDTFAIRSNTTSRELNHSMFLGQRVKDGIVDRFYEKKEKRPNVNPVNPDFWIDIHVRENIMTVSLDASGDSLHMRGYRVYPVDAPINEIMAAGMVLLSGWYGQTDFIDPMAGSGTIAIEAALLASGLPPQPSTRKYSFMKWKNFDIKLYEAVNTDVRAQVTSPKVKIICRDTSLQAVKAAETNAREAGVAQYITFERKDFFNTDTLSDFTAITNPPYDERLKLDDATQFYKSIGDQMKKYYTGSTFWIISSHVEALRNIGLKTSKRHHLLNGALEAEFQKFEVYAGSLRVKKEGDAE